MIRETEIGLFIDVDFEDATHLVHVNDSEYIVEILSDRRSVEVVDPGHWPTSIGRQFIFSEGRWHPVKEINKDAPTIEDIKQQLLTL